MPVFLPAFNHDGVLPSGDYELTLGELESSYLVTGEGVTGDWDAEWRKKLVRRLGVLVAQLESVGVHDVFADGSFVEDKPHPGDIDGYFVLAGRARDAFLQGRLEGQLNAIDPYRVWTWSRASLRPDIRTGKLKLPMWHRYRIELYPHIPGVLSGLADGYGNELEFPAAFRLSRRNWAPRGIVKIRRGQQ